MAEIEFDKGHTTGTLAIIRWKGPGATDRRSAWRRLVRKHYRRARQVFRGTDTDLTEVWAFPRGTTLRELKNSIRNELGRYDKVMLTRPWGSSEKGTSALRVHSRGVKFPT